MLDIRAVEATAEVVLDAVASDPRYGHTSHLQVRLGGDVVVDRHLRGPVRNDVFSVTKTVLALVLGRMAAQGRLPDLDTAVTVALPDLADTAARFCTWRHLLTMTRGAATDGLWDTDAVAALPGGQVRHFACAPQRFEAGSRFGYDNGSAHLLSAAACAVLREPVSEYARRELFEPLGITDSAWRADPDGVPYGYGHLQISADALGRFGDLLWQGGRHGSRQLIDPGFLADMLRRHTCGGPPENVPYGYLIWLDSPGPLMGGWAGQHVLVVPRAQAVVVVTGDPQFGFGPPASDRLPPDWRPALELVRRHLVPVLAPAPGT